MAVTRESEKLRVREAVAKNYALNKNKVNRKRALNGIKVGKVPFVDTFVKYSITYEEFTDARDLNGLELIEPEELYRLRFTAEPVSVFKKVFGDDSDSREFRKTAKKIPKSKEPTPEPISEPTKQEINCERDCPCDCDDKKDDKQEDNNDNNDKKITISDITTITYKDVDASFKQLKGYISEMSSLRKLMKILSVDPFGGKRDYSPKDKALWDPVNMVKMISDVPIKKIVELVNASSDKPATVRQRFNAINNMMKHVSMFNELLIKNHVDPEELRKTRNSYSTLVTESRDAATSLPGVPFKLFEDRQKQLVKSQPGSLQALIASMHVLIPTRRANEYGLVRLIYDNNSKPMEKDTENAYDVRSGLMRIAIYKTDETYGVYDVILPEKLQTIINDYIKKYKEDHDARPVYLYGSKMPMKDAQAREYFRQTFRGIGGIRELRRSYRTHVVRTLKYKLNEQRKVAYAMGQSLEMALTYERQLDQIDDDDEGEDEVTSKPPPKKKQRTKPKPNKKKAKRYNLRSGRK